MIKSSKQRRITFCQSKGKCGCSWASMNLLRQIKELLGMVEFELRHVYREANMVADSLANQAVHDRCSVADDFKGKEMLANLRISSAYAVVTKAMWVKWEPPPAGTLKLNVDGAAKGSYSAKGSCV